MKKYPTFSTPSPFELFLDLDGVLADFNGRIKLLTGKQPNELPKNRLWSSVARDGDFYYKLKLMPDADILWGYCKQYIPTFLTGLPMMKGSADQKTRWCAEKFGPEWKVICLMARDKKLHSGPNKVLVDDNMKNCNEWMEKGGVAILHTDVHETISKLEELRIAY